MAILIVAAVVPAVILLIKIYRLDRLERESPTLLLRLLIVGVASTILASLAEMAGEYLLALALPEEHPAADILRYFVIVAFAEEGFKYFVMKRRTWNDPQFNCQFDGVVYAAFVSLGFALWENIAYVMRYGMGTAIARAITAIPGHACFGVFMGVWYGAAKRQQSQGNEKACRASLFMAVLLPALLHGIYDFIATRESEDGSMSIVFIVFVALMFLASNSIAKRTARNDRYISYGTIDWP